MAKGKVLYDLSAEVEVDEEDLEVFQMVNRRAQEPRLVVETADGMYIIQAPKKRNLLAVVLGWISLILSVLVFAGAVIFSLVAISLPGSVSFWATVCGGLFLGAVVAALEKFIF